ncbi:MAG: type II secretion system protein [Verrucomicrobia bacterium]|nr:type II secretion system protein [Verrucomicrobiota bacterium]
MMVPLHTAGFSLVEVMCAILILGIGVVGLTHGLTTALDSSKDSEYQTTAALVAAGRIETLRADGDLAEGETDGDCGADLALYHWRQSITRTPTDGLYEVTVAVENAQSGKAIYELKTLLFDPSVYSNFRPATNRLDSTRDQRPNRRNR